MAEDYNNGYNLDNLKKLLNFKGKVEVRNLDEKLKDIILVFDENHDYELDNNELSKLLATIKKYNKNNNSVFDKKETNNFINN